VRGKVDESTNIRTSSEPPPRQMTEMTLFSNLN
jgi:hypothetical protein